MAFIVSTLPILWDHSIMTTTIRWCQFGMLHCLTNRLLLLLTLTHTHSLLSSSNSLILIYWSLGAGKSEDTEEEEAVAVAVAVPIDGWSIDGRARRERGCCPVSTSNHRRVNTHIVLRMFLFSLSEAHLAPLNVTVSCSFSFSFGYRVTHWRMFGCADVRCFIVFLALLSFLHCQLSIICLQRSSITVFAE